MKRGIDFTFSDIPDINKPIDYFAYIKFHPTRWFEIIINTRVIHPKKLVVYTCPM